MIRVNLKAKQQFCDLRLLAQPKIWHNAPMMITKRALLGVVLPMFILSGCSWFGINEDETNVIELANNLLSQQQDEHGEQKKVAMPVRINYSITRKAQIDKDLIIEFEIITEKALPILRIALKTTDGLELDGHNLEPLYQSLTARQVIKAEATVIPLLENKFYLDLYVITEIGEERLANVIKIPIAVGDYSLNNDPPARE